MDVSPHGIAFVALQLLVVLLLLWALARWHARSAEHARPPRPHRKHGVVVASGLGYMAWYVLLRTRPVARGAEVFDYTLGVFDGVSLSGGVVLVAVHVALSRRTGQKGHPSGME